MTWEEFIKSQDEVCQVPQVFWEGTSVPKTLSVSEILESQFTHHGRDAQYL